MSRIVIEQQFAQLGMRFTPAQLKIVNPHPEMSITTENPEMNIDWEAPSFEINWTDVNNESGLKNTEALTLTFRDKSVAKVYETIGEIVSEGNFIGSPEKKGPRIAQIEKNKNIKQGTVETTLALMPKSMPKIEWSPGYLNVSWNRHKIKIEWVGDYMPEMMVDPPHSIEIYLRQKPYIRITIEDGDPPPLTGQHIDEAV